MSMKPIARILLRYGSAALVTWGLLPADVAAGMADDPELVQGLAVAIGLIAAAVAETWYYFAKRYWGDT
jgi:hypothetical protein